MLFCQLFFELFDLVGVQLCLFECTGLFGMGRSYLRYFIGQHRQRNQMTTVQTVMSNGAPQQRQCFFTVAIDNVVRCNVATHATSNQSGRIDPFFFQSHQCQRNIVFFLKTWAGRHSQLRGQLSLPVGVVAAVVVVAVVAVVALLAVVVLTQHLHQTAQTNAIS